jgi:hypothetical protein
MALKELLDRLFEEEFAKLKEADEDVVTSEEEIEVEEPTPVEDPKSPTFEDDPLEYILFKYPTLTKTLEDLLSKDFRDYITGVYVIAPVPTTFKVVLHNNQSFYLIYMGRSWVAKVSGKKYYLLNLGEEERAKVAISNLLMMGKVKEDIQGPDQVSTESGDETAPAEEAPTEQPTETEPA